MLHLRDHRLLSFSPRFSVLLSIWGLLLAFTLSACSLGGTSTGNAATTTNGNTPTQQGNQSAPTNAAPISCSRVSEATIGQAIGLKVAPPHEMQNSTPHGNITFCIYQDAATSQIQELVISYVNGSFASQSFNSAVDNTPTTARQPISDLGDKAIFDTQRFRLHVLKGDLYFNIFLDKLSDQGDSKVLADTRQIAAAILANA